MNSVSETKVHFTNTYIILQCAEILMKFYSKRCFGFWLSSLGAFVKVIILGDYG